jgi:hypothetical protein
VCRFDCEATESGECGGGPQRRRCVVAGNNLGRALHLEEYEGVRRVRSIENEGGSEWRSPVRVTASVETEIPTRGSDRRCLGCGQEARKECEGGCGVPMWLGLRTGNKFDTRRSTATCRSRGNTGGGGGSIRCATKEKGVVQYGQVAMELEAFLACVAEGHEWVRRRARELAGSLKRRVTVPAIVDMWGRGEAGGC